MPLVNHTHYDKPTKITTVIKSTHLISHQLKKNVLGCNFCIISSINYILHWLKWEKPRIGCWQRIQSRDPESTGTPHSECLLLHNINVKTAEVSCPFDNLLVMTAAVQQCSYDSMCSM